MTAAGARKADPPKSAIPPLSPVGLIVRRVLVLASCLVPVVWLATIALGILLTRSRANDSWARIILVIGALYLPLLMAGWVWYVSVFRLRASLLELLLVLSAISLWPGLSLQDAEASELRDATSLILPFALIFAASACWIGGGALWGLSVSQRTGEERTWPRLGYLLLGCAMLAGFVATVPFAIASIWIIVNSIHSWTGRNDWQTPLIMLGISGPLVVAAVAGLSIERRCRKKYGPVNL
jgi:hypothetical protein